MAELARGEAARLEAERRRELATIAGQIATQSPRHVSRRGVPLHADPAATVTVNALVEAARPAAEGSELSIPPRSSARAARHVDPRRQRYEADEFREGDGQNRRLS